MRVHLCVRHTTRLSKSKSHAEPLINSLSNYRMKRPQMTRVRQSSRLTWAFQERNLEQKVPWSRKRWPATIAQCHRKSMYRELLRFRRWFKDEEVHRHPIHLVHRLHQHKHQHRHLLDLNLIRWLIRGQFIRYFSTPCTDLAASTPFSALFLF